jgi:hypothetical protein
MKKIAFLFAVLVLVSVAAMTANVVPASAAATVLRRRLLEGLVCDPEGCLVPRRLFD